MPENIRRGVCRTISSILITNYSEDKHREVREPQVQKPNYHHDASGTAGVQLSKYEFIDK